MIREEMYSMLASTLPFKDKLLRIQVRSCTSTSPCTSDQLRSNFESGPKDTRGCKSDLHSSRKDLKEPLQAPNYTTSLFKFFLPTDTFSFYVATARPDHGDIIGVPMKHDFTQARISSLYL